jgi:hypothetical protein
VEEAVEKVPEGVLEGAVEGVLEEAVEGVLEGAVEEVLEEAVEGKIAAGVQQKTIPHPSSRAVQILAVAPEIFLRLLQLHPVAVEKEGPHRLCPQAFNPPISAQMSPMSWLLAPCPAASQVLSRHHSMAVPTAVFPPPG